jgi:glycosyltransferase involved in cell wall biosynthesis
MKDDPLVSIVIPTCNRSNLLPRALRSALDQTYQNIEVIIVDDASADDTPQTVAGINDPRIRYMRHETNMGTSGSRNTAIKNARGKYIGFLDDDDEFDRSKIEKQLNVFAKKSDNTGIVYCGWNFTYDNKAVFEFFPRYKGNVFERILANNIMSASTVLVRSECFKKTGLFDTGLKNWEDWDMWIRIARYFDFDFVPGILMTYHVHGQQKSTSLQNSIIDRQALIEKYRADLLHHPSAYGCQLSRIGLLYIMNNSKKIGFQYIFRAIKKNPLAWKNYAYLILSLLDMVKNGTLEYFVAGKRNDVSLYY